VCNGSFIDASAMQSNVQKVVLYTTTVLYSSDGGSPNLSCCKGMLKLHVSLAHLGVIFEL